MKRINPIYLLIALNILLIFFRDLILPEETSAALATGVQSTLESLGVFGYAGIVAGYLVCGFFFVPLLIPLNILGGALYGAYVGTAIALAGVTVGTIASTWAVRHVFTGMQQTIEKRPLLQRLVQHADRHGNLTIILVRFAVIVPYLLQNIALAATNISVARIATIGAISAIPGAAIYSLLGAGLVRAEQASEMLFYLGVPIALLLVMSGAITYFNAKSSRQQATDDTQG